MCCRGQGIGFGVTRYLYHYHSLNCSNNKQLIQLQLARCTSLWNLNCLHVTVAVTLPFFTGFIQQMADHLLLHFQLSIGYVFHEVQLMCTHHANSVYNLNEEPDSPSLSLVLPFTFKNTNVVGKQIVARHCAIEML